MSLYNIQSERGIIMIILLARSKKCCALSFNLLEMVNRTFCSLCCQKAFCNLKRFLKNNGMLWLFPPRSFTCSSNYQITDLNQTISKFAANSYIMVGLLGMAIFQHRNSDSARMLSSASNELVSSEWYQPAVLIQDCQSEFSSLKFHTILLL